MPFRRVDPLTGHTSVVFDQTGKPVPARARAMPAPHGPCVFCAAVATLDESGTYTDPKFGVRPSAAHSVWGLSLLNAWPVMAPDLTPAPVGDPTVLSADGAAELVIPSRHVTSFEELTADEAAGLLALVDQRARALSHWPSVCVFANVGLAAGQSQPHLHFQVVGSELVMPTLAQEAASQGDTCAVCVDRDVSGPRLLTPHAPGSSSAGADPNAPASWVAAAANLPAEIRVAGPHEGPHDAFSAPVSSELLHTLTTFVSHVGPVAYNLAVHLPGPSGTPHASLHPHWHVMPRMGTGIGVYELGYGIGVGAVEPDSLAAALRDSASTAPA